MGETPHSVGGTPPHCEGKPPHCEGKPPTLWGFSPTLWARSAHTVGAIMPTVRGGRITAKTDNALHGQHALTSIASQESYVCHSVSRGECNQDHPGGCFT